MFEKLSLIISKEYKKKLIIIFFIMFFSVFIEMLSVGLILPILNLILNEDFISQYPRIFEITQQIGEFNFIAISLILLLALYVFKTMILLYFQIQVARTATDIGRHTSEKLYNKYLNNDYYFFVENNSSSIIRNTINETAYIFTFVYHLFTFLIEVLVFLGVIIVLFYLKPHETTILSLFILLVVIAYFAINKKKIVEISRSRIFNDGARLKSIQQGLSSIKEIQLYNKIKFFLNDFSTPNKKSYEALKKLRILQAIPRVLLELIIMSFLVILIFILHYRGLSFYEMVPILGLYLAAFLRILPSTARIMTSYQGVTYTLKSITIIHDEFQSNNNILKPKSIENSKILNFKEHLELKNVDFKYPKNEKEILKNLNFKINKNSIVGIVAKSGAGKSTLANIIMGILQPTKGEIKIDGININSNIRDWQSKVSYVPQNLNLIDASILENVAFGEHKNQIDFKIFQDAIKSSELTEFVNSLPDKYNTNVGEKGLKISGGQAQRIVIARSLYQCPNLLILDEATNSLDSKTEEAIMETIFKLKDKEQMTIIIISHKDDNIKRCDEILYLN